ncbi:MAG: pentapeptide repeat-containing protein [Polaromonas sp.]|nr:pentapeptide repeat-containing protein [Polaromonas sp.]
MKCSLVQVLLATAFLAASCGSSDTLTPASGVTAGTGSVPRYQSATEVLTLPQLRVAGTVATDVKLQLKQNGSWALLSAGPVRVVTASDAPGATLAGPGGNTDLSGAQTDTTLTVARLHVDSRVFGNVEVRLKGKTWAFASSLQEVKTLQQEDFKSNTAIRADESHHVILKSSPDSGVQNVPLQLSSRSYKFCMDAQAEGADSTTLLDATDTIVFTLKAGDACVTINAKEGAHTLQHRYGGTGSTRTVFMRHQANTTAAAAAAVRVPAPALRLQRANVVPRASAETESFTGTDEYWSVKIASDASNSLGFLGVVGRSSSKFPTAGPTFCADPLNFGFSNLWLSNTFMPVLRDRFGTPQQLGLPLACTSNPFIQSLGLETSYITDVGTTGNQNIRSAFQIPGKTTDWGTPPFGQQFAGYINNKTAWAAQSLMISSQSASAFELTSNGQGLALAPPNNDSAAYGYDYGNMNHQLSAGSPSLPLRAVFRYFPIRLPSSITLGVGQVALFTGAGCTGAAVISELGSLPYFSDSNVADINAFGPPLYEPTYLPVMAALGTSFQLGLQTSATAYTGQYYQGQKQQLDQLTCNAMGVNFSGQPAGSLQVTVETVTMVISTNSCEYCNLTGLDFSGLNLTNAKLSYANLNGVNLSNADLSGADLRNATLQGAQLIGTNLDSANLCAAQLNGSAEVGQAATLTRAHLRDTNLANANLDGVKFSSASFYSSSAQGVCQPTSCASYVAPTCASAYNASMNNTSFDSAYLSNIDMSNVKGVGVNFSNAALFGVSLAGADLSHNNLSSVSSSFNNAYLQGTDFSRAILKFADFTGARFDPGSSCIQANLPPSYGQFPGSKVPTAPGSASCVPGKPTAAFCVQTQFAASPIYPATDCTNICADGTRGGQIGPQNGSCSGTSTCSVASWAAPLGGGNSALPTSSCVASAPLCGNPFTGDITNRCW